MDIFKVKRFILTLALLGSSCSVRAQDADLLADGGVKGHLQGGWDKYSEDLVAITGPGDIYRLYDSYWIKWRNPQPYRTPFRRNEIMNFTPDRFWIGGFEFLGDETFPAKPNCSESSFTIQDFLKIANDPNVQTSMDFVDKIPKGSLQRFTFIYDSHSLQNDGVNYLNPRIMRFSTDGRFALTYTCDPNTWAFNSIEAIYFDDKTRKYNLVHASFPTRWNEEAIVHQRTSKKISINHKSCLACHNGSDPRPNWNEYDFWPGTYGSHDDKLGTIEGERLIWGTFDKAIAAKTEEFEGHPDLRKQEALKYQEFRKLRANDLCVASLPWPSKKSKTFEHYPYIGIHKLMNYQYRPNAQYTISSSRLNAQRLARKFEDHKYWGKIRIPLMMEALRCEEGILDKYIPGISQLKCEDNYDTFCLNEWSKGWFDDEILIKLGIVMGFYGSDWTTYFHKGGPSIKDKHFTTSQWMMPEFTLSVLFRDLAKDIPELASYDRRVNRMSQYFGREFMCVDEVADRLWLGKTERQEVCRILEKKLSQEAPLSESLIFSEDYTETRDGAPQRSVVNQPTVMHGQRIAKTVCGQCHDGNVLKYNFLEESALLSQLKYYGVDAVIGLVDMKTGTEQECEMPMPMAGACLSKNEKESLIMYLADLDKFPMQGQPAVTANVPPTRKVNPDEYYSKELPPRPREMLRKLLGEGYK